MEIRLQKLILTNFKGIKALTLDLAGKSASIYGANATGKTTIYDAFLWLLFDKDSQNKTNFNIKTLDKFGEPLHGLDHEVEAVLNVDGRELTLKKSYKEKWTKKRGSASAEFAGHTTDHYIDGIPVKKSEYDQRIAELINEDIFKLLTSPTYFNEQLKWEERRRILLEICGDVSYDEVLDSDEIFSRLPEILQGRSIEDHQKLIEARRRDINKELQQLPPRIDEVMRGLPDVSDIDAEALPSDIAEAEAAIQKCNEQLAELRAGGSVAAKTKELNELDAEIARLKTEIYGEIDAAIQSKREELSKVRESISDYQFRLRQVEGHCKALEGELATLNNDIEKFRAEWYRINEQQWNGDETCPTCGQPLPKEQVEEARATFNRKKAAKLESITIAGKATSASIKTINEDLEKTRDRLKELQAKLKELQRQEASLLDDIKHLQQKTESTTTPELIEKQKQRERLVAQIEDLLFDNSEAIAEVEKTLTTWRDALQALRDAEVRLKARERGQQRIEELQQRERELAAEYERLEEELYLCEQYIRTKVDMLEDRINEHFKLARFKLFNTLVNGAIEETCLTTYEGVPYDDMNKAARINTGLDIIRTLSRHYNFSAPIFIDNAEAVVELLPIETQVVRLVVSGKDKKLRIETEES